MPAIVQKKRFIAPIETANVNNFGLSTRLGIATIDPASPASPTSSAGVRSTVTVITVVTPDATSSPTVPSFTGSPSSSIALPAVTVAPAPAANTIAPPPSAAANPVVQAGNPSSQNDQAPAPAHHASKKGLTPGGVAGIVLTLLIVFAALGVFLYRKKSVQNRAKKRSMWTVKPYNIGGPTNFKTGEEAAAAFGGLGALSGMVAAARGHGQDSQLGTNGVNVTTTYNTSTDEKAEDKDGSMMQIGQGAISVAALPNPYQPAHTHHRSTSGSPFVLGKPPPGGKGMKRKPSPKSTSSMSGVLSPTEGSSPSSYLSVLPAGAAPPAIPGYPAMPQPAANSKTSRGPVNAGAMAGARGPSNMYKVIHTYLPSRADEMGVELGEDIKVVAAYDDGWAYCSKPHTGEEGMVPVACWSDEDVEAMSMAPVEEELESRTPKMFAEGREIRLSKRESSLQVQRK